MNHAVLRFRDVTVAYGRRPAVHHLSGEIGPGELVAITGPNGAGKSSLLKAMIGELPLAGGRIERGGATPRDLAYLPQAAEIDRRFPLSVADAVLMGAWRTIGALRRPDEALAGRAAGALASVGLTGFERRPIGSLSAGQVQRVLFARLLLQDAPVIVLDEPFTAIDARTTRDLVDIVRRWHGEGRTVIAVLHDLDQIRRHFDRTLLLAREAVDWGPTDRVLSAANLLKARAMSEAWDENAPVRRAPARASA